MKTDTIVTVCGNEFWVGMPSDAAYQSIIYSGSLDMFAGYGYTINNTPAEIVDWAESMGYVVMFHKE